MTIAVVAIWIVAVYIPWTRIARQVVCGPKDSRRREVMMELVKLGKNE